ncbi:MAG TPA: signal peptidase II [Chloroflexia bacterium]|nr:signal peptidase II [Chloroflexia bacterium]
MEVRNPPVPSNAAGDPAPAAVDSGPVAAQPPMTVAARVRAVLPLLALAALILIADQLTKLWIVAAIGRAAPAHEIDIIPGWLVFQYVENTGAAFGMFTNGSWLLAFIAVAVVVGIVVMAPRMQQEATAGLPRWQILLSLGLVLGGAVGNLADRLTRGYVVDFVLVPKAQITLGNTLYHFPNFNVADSAITVGIILLLIGLLFAGERK